MTVVVSSFSPKGWKEYGQQFVEGFVEHWPSAKLYVGTDDDPANYPAYDRVTWFHIGTKTSEALKAHTPKHLLESGDYRFQAWKFCQKVLAVSDPSIEDSAVRYWLDADVTFNKRVPGNLHERFQEYDYAYLGRRDWHHTETGVLGFKMSPGVKAMLQRWRWFFETGRVFSLAEWHDCYVFDHVRREFNGLRGFNISYGCSGLNVWPQTYLEEFMTHHKGALKRNIGAK